LALKKGRAVIASILGLLIAAGPMVAASELILFDFDEAMPQRHGRTCHVDTASRCAQKASTRLTLASWRLEFLI
jgi:hypothetical protein